MFTFANIVLASSGVSTTVGRFATTAPPSAPAGDFPTTAITPGARRAVGTIPFVLILTSMNGYATAIVMLTSPLLFQFSSDRDQSDAFACEPSACRAPPVLAL